MVKSLCLAVGLLGGLAGGAVLAGFGLAVVARAAQNLPRLAAVDAGQQAIVQGMVSAKSADSLVVADQTIDTPATTPCEKDGRRIMLSDIVVGDWLKVTVYRDPAHDRLQAMAIEVMARQD